ncbi:TIGR04255 family protein [Agrobacterium cavarae]|uniref:TIGR04255 family protein n=1 Tax=Agrobacterium cavarae TaxID=2528239 RepID=UPI003FD12864
MFEPMNKGHAISEATFFFEFDNIPTPILNAMLATHNAVADLLPRNDPAFGMMFEQSSAGFSMNQIPGAEWKHFSPDGNASWIARIMQNTVSVHCLQYNRWSEVWPKAFRILAAIFSAAKGQPLPLSNVGLRYVDRFDFKGDVRNYTLQSLIRRDSPHVADRVLNAGPRWHNYTGWFDTSDELRTEILQQLNIDAIVQMGTNLPIVSVTHASVVRGENPAELDKYRDFTHISESPVAKLMATARNNNHKLLRELLTDDMLKRIDLGMGE